MKKGLRSKEYFRAVRDEQVELWAMEQKFYSSYMELMPSGITYDRDKVQTSPRDSMPEKFAALDDLERKIGEGHERLLQRRSHAFDLVERLGDARQRTVMKLYYLTVRAAMHKQKRFNSWWDVADLMGCSDVKTVQRLHGAALVELEKFFPEK